MDITSKEKLPSGYSLDEEGRFIHEIPEEEILEMRKIDNKMLALAILNIIEGLFIILLVFAHFYNH